MKFVEVDPHDYAHKQVPLMQIKAVKVLNELVAIDKKAVTEALGSGDHLLGPEAFAKFVEHPHVIVGETLGGMPVISGLGILNGILMSKHFRLCLVTEEDDHTIHRFYIVEDIDAKETP
jgi:hypothetical protein